MKKRHFTKLVAVLLSISLLISCGTVLVSAAPALGEDVTNDDIEVDFIQATPVDMKGLSATVYHQAKVNGEDYSSKLSNSYDPETAVLNVKANMVVNWAWIEHTVVVNRSQGLNEFTFSSKLQKDISVPLFVLTDGTVCGLRVESGDSITYFGVISDTMGFTKETSNWNWIADISSHYSNDDVNYKIKYSDDLKSVTFTITKQDGTQITSKTKNVTKFVAGTTETIDNTKIAIPFKDKTNSSSYSLNANHTVTVYINAVNNTPILDFVNANKVLNVIKRDVAAGTFDVNTYISDGYYPLVEAAETAFAAITEEALRNSIVANGFYDADKIQAIKIAKLVADATGPVGQYVSQNTVVTQLSAVTDGDGMVAAVTEENAEQIIKAYEEYALLEDQVKSDLEFVCADLENKLMAAKLRAEIFTTGEFNYVPAQHATADTYILDPTGTYIALTKAAGDTPEVTFVQSVRPEEVGQSWNNVVLLKYADLSSSHVSNVTQLHAKPVLDGENIVFANVGDDPAALTSAQYQSFPLLEFNSSTEKFIIGNVVSAQNVMKDLTYTVKWDASDEWRTPKYTVSNGTQQRSGYITYGVSSSGGAITETQFRSIMIRVHDTDVELKSVKYVYPELKAQAQELQALAKPELRGATIKITDTLEDQDIRFNAYFTEVATDNYEIVSYGFLMMPTLELGGNELNVDTDNAKKKEVSVMVGSGVPEQFYYSTEDAGLTSGFANAEALDSAFTARSYVVYKNVNSGKEHVLYSQPVSRSVSAILKSIATAVVGNSEQHPEWGWVVSSTKTETGAISVNVDFSGVTVTVGTIEDALLTYGINEKKLLLEFILYNRIAIV